MSLPQPRSGILEITPYKAAAAGRAHPVRLNANENPLGCSPRAREAYVAAQDGIHRYPDGGATALRNAIAALHGMDAGRIVCGAGADELIALIIRAYAGAGDEVVHSAHGFIMYRLAAQAAGAAPVSAPEKDMRGDVETLLAAVSPRTKIMFVANPNNPTGSLLSADELKYLREKLPEHVLLVVDAAYAEYVAESDYGDGRALADATPNTVMLRTFSKVYGLAGLRIGWGYFPQAVADVINRVRGAFNTGVAAQMAGIAALADQDFVKKSCLFNHAERAALAEGLQKAGLKVYPSAANFLLADCGARAETIRDGLAARNILVMHATGYGLPQCLRVSVGLPEENARLLAALKEI